VASVERLADPGEEDGEMAPDAGETPDA